MGFLLCDPALIAPIEGTTSEGGDFWQRVIDWNADNRLYLGPLTQDLVFAIFDDLGWPDYQPPGCPTALSQNARRSVTKLLGRVRLPSAPHDGLTPALTPTHRGGSLIEEAIGEDAASLADDGLIGIASHADAWESRDPAGNVAFDPPPPEPLPLVFDPRDSLEAERDENTATYLRRRRITIIGGRKSPQVKGTLERQFGLGTDQIRWIEGDPSIALNLDPLGQLREDRDVVIVVTDYVGHPEELRVEKACEKGNCAMHRVVRKGEIYALLRKEFGAPASDDERS